MPYSNPEIVVAIIIFMVGYVAKIALEDRRQGIRDEQDQQRQLILDQRTNDLPYDWEQERDFDTV